jgi:hypothetical protein
VVGDAKRRTIEARSASEECALLAFPSRFLADTDHDYMVPASGFYGRVNNPDSMKGLGPSVGPKGPAATNADHAAHGARSVPSAKGTALEYHGPHDPFLLNSLRLNGPTVRRRRFNLQALHQSRGRSIGHSTKTPFIGYRFPEAIV